MTAPDTLRVWNDQRPVGSLWRNTSGNIGFRYDPAWISSGGFSISHTLPLGTGDFGPEESIAHRFFANLLPEGGARETVVRDLKITDTDFELLRAIGGECAGALSILPVDRQPSGIGQYHPLTEKELARLVARRGGFYSDWPAGERPRLSLAGAQNKCPVLLENDQFFLPQQEAPSSHILKFELADHRHLPAYETFTTQLAKTLDLPVVEIELRSIAKTHYALVARYDRLRNERGEIERLHQEDFCQALGIGHEKKYQDAGGPSFDQCYRLLQNASSDPAIDTQNLLRWQIFNVLAGNSDGHAKNLSLLRRPNGQTRLAPFYDLICTRAIERIDDQLAFDVGGQRHPSLITTDDWNTLAKRCDIHPRFLKKLIEDTADRLLNNLSQAKTSFESRYGPYPALQRIERIVTKQCQRAAVQAKKIKT